MISRYVLKLAEFCYSHLAALTILLLLPGLLSCSPSQSKYAYGWERNFYPSLSGRVVDAETGESIEDAVVFCVWKMQHGLPGMTYTKVYKVSETVTDKQGFFRIEGTWNPNVDHPDLTVYKKGFVAWNNKEVFPTDERRKDFAWTDGVYIKMAKWKDVFSFVDHEGFIARYTKDSEIDKHDYRLFKVMEWETPHYISEMDKRDEEKRRKKGDGHE